MRLAKTPVAIGLTAALTIGGGIAAFADGDSAPEPARQSARGATTPMPSAPAPTGVPAPAATGVPPSPAPCGAAAAEVLASTAGQVAERIYAGEEHGVETQQDRRQIASYGPLLSALRTGSQSAVRAAVNELVFSHTHIVRLRVSSGSRLLADVGGPYILAPVQGVLRSGGRTLGRFAFSVQDDLGYIKLVTRFIGVPLVLRTPGGQIPVPGQATPGSARIPDRGTFSYRGAGYRAYSFRASAYPQGPLRVSLLVPPQPRLAALGCSQVRADETATVARRVARRFALAPSNVPVYATLLHSLTVALVYVHVGGRTYVAGTRRVAHRIPSSGTVHVGGRAYTVSSLTLPTTAGAARVQVLVPG